MAPCRPDRIRLVAGVRDGRGDVAVSGKHRLTYYADRKKLYQQYLRSKEWKALRLKVFVRDKQCTKCGRKDRLQAHHLHYANFGDENLDDIITLCEDCHNIEHGGSPRGQGRWRKNKPAAKANKPKKTKQEKEALRMAAIHRKEMLERLDAMTLADIRKRKKQPRTRD